MGEIFKLFGTIGLNNKEANEGIDETTGKAKSAGGKIAGFFKKAAIAIGTAFAATKVLGFGKMAVEAAATAKAIQSQFDQVFGNLGTEAQKKVEELGKSFGMLPNRLKQPFAATVSMFKGLGMTTEEAMKQAETSVTAAADAAAFYDVSYESANASLTSFLKGNYEAGESIGIFANDTQMAQYAISQGVVSSTAEWQKLDEATKQATRLEYAKNMQEQAGATGQAARESEGYENQMGNLKQAWQDFLAIVGGPILEPVVAGLMKVSDWLSTSGEKVIAFQSWLSELKAEVADSTAWSTLKEVMQPVVDAFQSMKDTMSNSTFLDDIKSALTDLKDAMLEVDFVKLSTDIQAFIEKWLPLIAGISAAAAAYGLYTLALGIKSAAETIAILSMYGMAAATTALNGALAILTSPITLVIAAIVALVAIGVWLWQNWDMVSEMASEIWGGIATFFSETWQSIKQGTEAAWNAISEFFSGLWASITAGATEAWQSFSTWISGIWNSIVSGATSIWNGLVNVFTFVWLLIKEVFHAGWLLISVPLMLAWQMIVIAALAIWQPLAAFFTMLWDGIKNIFTTVWTSIVGFLTPIWNSIKTTVTTVFNSIKAFFTTIWSAISSVFNIVISAIVAFVVSRFNNLKNNIMIIFNVVKSVATTVWNAIKTVFTVVVSAIVAFVVSRFNNLKNNVTTVFNAIKSVTTTVWNAIKNAIQTAVNAVKSVVTSVFNSVKSTVSSIFNSIKSTASSIWNGIKSTISNVVNGIKSTVSNGFNSVKSSVSNVWNSIKSAITTPINAAKDAVGKAIDKIKGLMNFSWSLPKLKMPKFSVSGKFSLNPPSVPKLGIDWHAAGGIFDKATLFNTSSGMHGVGEAGPEAIIPLNRETLSGIGEGISKASGMNSNEIKEMLWSILEELRSFGDKPVVVNVELDGQVIARVIRDPLDVENGRKVKNIGRGLA